MIWTSCLALILAISQAYDLVSQARFTPIPGRNWPAFVSAGAVVAVVLVVAFWAALGSGPARLGCMLLGLATCTIGAGMLASNVLVDNRFPPSYWGTTGYWNYILGHDWWIVAWVYLAGGMLYSALLMHRALGYRLVRIAANNPPRSTPIGNL
jgi:hypothetical protein